MEKSIEQLASELAHNLSPDQLREQWEKRQGIEQRPEISESERAYWKTVFHFDPKQMAMIYHSFGVKQEMTYDEARRKFWAVLQFRAATIETMTDAPFVWSFDDAEKEILQNIVRYFINDTESQYPLCKGLFVYGAPGTGKTEIMQAAQKFCESNDLKKSFRFTSMSAVYIETKTNKDFDPVSENVMYDRAFDEFGRNSGAVMRFGDSLDINEAIVELRYERWKRYGQLSHFIANATPNEVKTLFSPMVFDRIREMCTSVLFPGKSKRK